MKEKVCCVVMYWMYHIFYVVIRMQRIKLVS